uniref:Uncharacterized protein n=1 Tax=Amphimedon queenslandica TaxID=400682 RepID=A0A1X7T706_AMPQE
MDAQELLTNTVLGGHISIEYFETDSIHDTTTSTCDIQAEDSQDTPLDLKKISAQFILSTRDGHNLTQSALDGVLTGVTMFHEQNIELVKAKAVISETSTIFKEMQCPFDDLETEYKQNQYFKKHLSLLIFNSNAASDGILKDFCDGQLYKNNSLFCSAPHALQLFLYYDDVEVCNPLGSAATVHKLGLFYYTLGNIESRHRANLDTIQLVSVVKSSYIDKYGMDTILQPFIESIQILESSGVEFIVKGNKRHLKGTLCLAIADNPASQALGGYKMLASALRKCRHCLAVDSEIQTKFFAEEFEPRTKETHSHHIRLLQGPLHDHVSTTYGITRDTALNKIKYFHVTMGLPPDVMHDILEGAMQVELRCLLTALINDKIISLPVLNERILSLPYGNDVSDHPKPLPETYFTRNTKKMGASETWALARLLPILIGDLITMAPKCTVGLAAHLRQLIHQHHSTFLECYPDRTLTPKLHYMIHIPQWMIKCGPLSKLWCMRFEAKHRYFKQIAKVVACVKEASSLEYTSAFLSYFPGFNLRTQLNIVNWINVKGTQYKRNDCLLIEFQNDEPVFSRIADIAFVESCPGPIIIGEALTTLSYNSHYHSYEVRSNGTFLIIDLDKIIDHNVLTMYQTFQNYSTYYITLKYYIINDFDV